MGIVQKHNTEPAKAHLAGIEADVEEQKTELLHECQCYIRASLGDAKRQQLQAVHSAATDLFNKNEKLARALLGLPRSVRHEQWAKEYADTCLNVLDTAIRTYQMLITKPTGRRLSNTVSPTAFAGAQRVVKRYCPDEVESMRNRFQDVNLPIKGFTHPAKDPLSWPATCGGSALFLILLGILLWLSVSHPWQAALGLGVICIAISVVLAIVHPEPSTYQALVFRVVLATGVGAAGWIICGSLNITVKLGFSVVRAVGSVTLFVLVYLWNPPALVEGKASAKKKRAQS